MEEPTNQLVEKTQEAHNEVPNSSLALLRDNLEFFGVRANFYNETVIIKEIVHKIELKDKDLPKKEQELLDNFEEKAEVKKNLVNILEEPKSQQKVETNQKNDETFIRTNGFYYCPECKYKTRWSMDNLKIHINAVHRQLKPFECSDCAKTFSRKANLSQHRLNMHNTNKSCICDHCGSRFGFEHQLKLHKVIHTQPTFSCSECDNKFLRVYSLNNHKKLHQGILSEICETCNKGYATKIGLYDHIISNHFARLHCEVTGCSSNFNCKKSYKAHLKTMHTKSDQVLIENLLINLEKLMPNFRQFKYV